MASTVPGIVDDGDWTIARQNGAPEFSFPFAYRGDTKTFIAKVNMTVDTEHYKPLAPMSQRWFQNLGKAYLVDEDPPAQVSQRLMAYALHYANIPQNAKEVGSTTYTLQFPKINDWGIDAELVQYVDTFDATIDYEYSIFKPLPELFYGRLILAPFTDPSDPAIVFQAVNIIGTSYARNIAGGTLEALAQNSTSRRYAGQIYERMSVWAKISFVQSTPRVLVLPPAPP